MREIYLIRHGSTRLNGDAANSVDKIRGWANVPLSDEGKQEAKDTAEKLKNSGIQAIISSDLQRAMDTAHALSKTTGAPVTPTIKLRPWDLGEMTGQATKESLPKIANYAENKPTQAIPKGESFNSFKRRAFQGIKEALDDNRGKKIALVTHHRIERLLKAWIAKSQPSDHSIDLKTFLQKGEAPANAEILKINEENLGSKGNKAVIKSLGKAMK